MSNNNNVNLWQSVFMCSENVQPGFCSRGAIQQPPPPGWPSSAVAGFRLFLSCRAPLRRILQVCGKEVDSKSNAAMWGSITATDLINHVLDYIAWALDHEKVEGSGVTIAWLEKSGGGKGCGAMRMVMASSRPGSL